MLSQAWLTQVNAYMCRCSRQPLSPEQNSGRTHSAIQAYDSEAPTGNGDGSSNISRPQDLRRLRVMRVGEHLQSVVSHRLDAGLMIGAKYTATVSIDSATDVPNALFGRDPPRFSQIGAVMDGSGRIVVALQGKTDRKLYMGSFHSGVSLGSENACQQHVISVALGYIWKSLICS